MMKYDNDEFCTWIQQQPGGSSIACSLSPQQIYHLHDICNAFNMEVENEAIREEIRYEQQQREERDARTAREATARKNAADAAAEVEARREYI